MARSRRGGPRTPRNPAPVSGPGALSARTDGGPSQPIREFPAEHHGQRSALRTQQQGAPLPVAGSAPTPMVNNGMGGGVFGPTERPDEPVTAGAEPAAVELSVDDMLGIIYANFPHPGILRLIRGG